MRRHESRATVHWEIDRRGKAVRWFCMGNERRRLIITREETRFSTWPSAFPGAWKWSDEHSCAEDEKINNSLRACIYICTRFSRDHRTAHLDRTLGVLTNFQILFSNIIFFSFKYLSSNSISKSLYCYFENNLFVSKTTKLHYYTFRIKIQSIYFQLNDLFVISWNKFAFIVWGGSLFVVWFWYKCLYVFIFYSMA